MLEAIESGVATCASADMVIALLRGCNNRTGRRPLTGLCLDVLLAVEVAEGIEEGHWVWRTRSPARCFRARPSCAHTPFTGSGFVADRRRRRTRPLFGLRSERARHVGDGEPAVQFVEGGVRATLVGWLLSPAVRMTSSTRT